MKKAITLMLAMIMFVAVVGGCAPAAAPGETPGAAPTAPGDTAAEEVPVIRIGILHGVTGPLAAVGQEFVGTVMAAVDIINNPHPQLGDFPFAAGEGLPNLGGARIEIVVADTQSNPEIAAIEADRLINAEGVVALAGGHLSGVALTASVTAERNRVPYITGTATSPPLTDRGLEYFFRATPHDGTFARNAFDFLDSIREQYGIETIAIVAEEAEFGAMQRELYTQEALARGYTIVESFLYPSAPVSITSEAIRIAAAQPDVIFQASQGPEAILFTQAFRQFDVRPTAWITGRAGFISPEWFDAVGTDANYVMTINAWSLDLARVKPFIDDINEIVVRHAGVPLNGDYAREFDAFMILVDAINRAGSTDSAAITQALRETNMSADWLVCPWPGVRFDETGQNVYGDGIMTQVHNQEYVTIWPEAVATAQWVIPMPPWS